MSCKVLQQKDSVFLLSLFNVLQYKSPLFSPSMRKTTNAAIFRGKTSEEVLLILEDLEQLKRVSECRIYQIKSNKNKELN